MAIKVEPVALKVMGVVGLDAAQEMLNSRLIDVGCAVVKGESLLVSPDDANLRDEGDYRWFEAVVISLLHEHGEAAARGTVHPPQ
ncbi:hypothetical protein HNP48_002753 [Acidovorax soli]|uniref:Uncharacterized protein n=1 Tax=Acidovorax soli TaxID=592050 RepID=A0A7X0PDZ9_9BURK|nr:hypothetical protein [Acidovorax soli]MBB6560081.1 hypothetical protein [Acidovorax soli]